MSKISFDADVRHLPAIALAFYQVATIAVMQVGRERGYGPWFEELREQAKNSMANAIPDDIPPGDERDFLKAGLDAVDFLFDRFVWR